MREIILDTETTGLSPEDGHRIIEIGAIEVVNRMPTGNQYHQYINPQRSVPSEAFSVHGISDDFLSDKPIFVDIADDFIQFVGDATLVIHNAPFDMKFINFELEKIGKPLISMAKTVDTLLLARKKFPGAKNNLDALCKRFSISNDHRNFHGALLDSELLLDVYLELLGGRQLAMGLDHADGQAPSSDKSTDSVGYQKALQKSLGPWSIRKPSLEEHQDHEKMVETLKDALWRKLS